MELGGKGYCVYDCAANEWEPVLGEGGLLGESGAEVGGKGVGVVVDVGEKVVLVEWVQEEHYAESELLFVLVDVGFEEFVFFVVEERALGRG